MALVFEDDVALIPNFNSKLIQVINELPEDWDFVNLNPNYMYKIDYRRFSDNLFTGQALNASAYLIRLKCAKQWSMWDSSLLKVQVDSLMTQCPVRAFHVKTSLANQENGKTEIGRGFGDRTMDWQVFLNRWGQLIVFIIFILLVRQVIFE